MSETAKNLKDVIDAIERVGKLETDLQQQIAKAEPSQRIELAAELASAFGGHQTLVKERARLLQTLQPTKSATQP